MVFHSLKTGKFAKRTPRDQKPVLKPLATQSRGKKSNIAYSGTSKNISSSSSQYIPLQNIKNTKNTKFSKIPKISKNGKISENVPFPSSCQHSQAPFNPSSHFLQNSEDCYNYENLQNYQNSQNPEPKKKIVKSEYIPKYSSVGQKFPKEKSVLLDLLKQYSLVAYYAKLLSLGFTDLHPQLDLYRLLEKAKQYETTKKKSKKHYKL